MNQTFKVVFSAARGALMVVNELTRSVQGKGTKTVVAVAAAALCGVAAAEDLQPNTDLTLEGHSNQTQNSNKNCFGGDYSYSRKNVTAVDQVFDGNYLGYIDEKETPDAQGGALYLNAQHAENEGTVIKYENTVNHFERVVFSNNTVRTNSNSGNRPSAYGGAVTLKGGTTTFLNTTFTGNKAIAEDTTANTSSNAAYGGGSAAGGAVLVDSVRNKQNFRASVIFSATTDITNTGNTVQSGLKGSFTDAYGTKVPTAGGFLYQDRETMATFDIDEGVTYTVGVLDAWKTDANMDSIASSVRVNSSVEENQLNKTGAGLFVMNGQMSDYYGIVNVQEGTLRVTSDWAVANAVNVNGGLLELGNLSFTTVKEASGYKEADIQDAAGKINVAGGELIVSNATLKEGSIAISGTGLVHIDKLTTSGKDNITMSSGTLDLTIEQVFGSTTSTTVGEAFNLTGGTLDFSNETVTKSWLTAALSGKNFTIAVNVTGDDGAAIEEVKTDDLIANVILPEAELTVTDSTVVLGKANAGVQTITSEKPLEKVTVSESFTLIGDGTTVLGNEHEDGATITVAENKTLTLGLANGSGGGTIQGSIDGSGNLAVAGGDFAVNGGIKTNTLNVAAGAALTTTSVTLAANSTVSGELTADSLSLSSGTVSVEGTLGVSTLAADVTLEDGGTLLLNAADQTQKAVPVMALARSFALTPRAEEVPVTASLVNGTVTANAGALVTTREGGEALVKSAAEKAGITYDSTKAGFYVDSQILLGENGKFKIGTTSGTNDVNLGSDALMVVDASAFAEGVAAIAHRNDSPVTVTSENATLILSNLTNRQTDTITVFDGASSIENLNVKSDSIFYTPTLGDDGSVTVETKQGADLGITDSELAAAVNAITAVGSGASATLTTYLDQLGKETSGYVNNGKFTAAAQNALRTTLTLPVASGALNVAYDAQSLVNDAVTNRALAVKGQGTQAWVDLFGTTNEAKYEGLTTGYDADIYGGVFGVDTTLDNGLLVGGAVTIGTADTDATGTAYKVTTDTDFYGFSLYGAKTFAGLNVKADVGYTKFDNTVKAYDLGQKLGGDADADAWTVGLRGDFTAVDAAVAVKPHFGVRYTRLTVDGLNGVDVSNLNVLELPVGVAFEGAVEAGGWKIAPALDLSVVPQLGDDEVTTSVAGEAIRTTVLDNLYNAALGVSAEYQSMTFGLNYRYGFGSNDRSNNALHATFRYAF